MAGVRVAARAQPVRPVRRQAPADVHRRVTQRTIKVRRVKTVLINLLKNEAGSIAQNCRLRVSGLINDERGVSAVEFATLLPLMLALYLGAVEVSQGIGADRKVTLTARTVADLVSQISSVNNSDMTTSLNAASAESGLVMLLLFMDDTCEDW